MTNLPCAWAVYAHLQSRVSSLSVLDDHAWGLDGALNVILQPDFSAMVASEGEFRRAAASASRKRRDHVARFLAEFDEKSDAPDDRDLIDQVAAKEALRAIQTGLDRPEDSFLVSAIAQGQDYKYLANLLGQPEGSLRSRTLRLRRKFAHLKP